MLWLGLAAIAIGGGALALRQRQTVAARLTMSAPAPPGQSPILARQESSARGPAGADPARVRLDLDYYEQARLALPGIVKARVACADGDEEGCVRHAYACSPFAGSPHAAAPLPTMSSFELASQLREACRGALSRLQKGCKEGSLKACDAVLSSHASMNEADLTRACDLGSARACRRSIEHLPRESVEREATTLRAEALEICAATPSVLCQVPSQAQLSANALARLKRRAMDTCRAETAEECSRYADIYARPPMVDLALSAQLVQEGCYKGDANACSRLSQLLAEGRGLPRDQRRALQLRDRDVTAALAQLERCEGDHCALLRYAYLKAGGDMAEQHRRAELAPDEVARECEAGKLGACQGLRSAYRGGASRLAEDLTQAAYYGAKANALTERQCQTGDRDACKLLAQYLLYAPPIDVARGQRLADDACARDGYLDCWLLGEFFDYGGSTRDVAMAQTYYAKAVASALQACHGGNAGACELVGSAYLRGSGVRQDERKFAEYTMKALELSRSE